MDPNTFPTKGNLILAKNSLKLSRQGYELMDKKRNILIREMMDLIDQAKDIHFPRRLRCAPEGKYGNRHCLCPADCLYRSHREFHPYQNPKRYGYGDSSCGI